MGFDLSPVPDGKCRDCRIAAAHNAYGRCLTCQREHDEYLSEKMRAEHGPSRPDNSFRAHEHSTYHPVKGKA